MEMQSSLTFRINGIFIIYFNYIFGDVSFLVNTFFSILLTASLNFNVTNYVNQCCIKNFIKFYLNLQKIYYCEERSDDANNQTHVY
ncbi:hypothetical protein BpHYR1_048083 [Brachionus plicatilis]|uniref:Uncharacterized protein n=1 Tax=Brachionus plicatilis TaxID=10195 RepID=A0A3M7PX82_BRAPC|nr:hypothetical protein BpHYR1_048083 [Brachionus plicatilis]